MAWPRTAAHQTACVEGSSVCGASVWVIMILLIFIFALVLIVQDHSGTALE
jgi:hypothetical protein